MYFITRTETIYINQQCLCYLEKEIYFCVGYRADRIHIARKRKEKLSPAVAKWITLKLYLFLTSKLKSRFGIRSRIQSENVVIMMVEYVNKMKNKIYNFFEIVEELKCDLANLNTMKTHLDFHYFGFIQFYGYFQNKIFYSMTVIHST